MNGGSPRTPESPLTTSEKTWPGDGTPLHGEPSHKRVVVSLFALAARESLISVEKVAVPRPLSPQVVASALTVMSTEVPTTFALSTCTKNQATASPFPGIVPEKLVGASAVRPEPTLIETQTACGDES